MPRCCVEDKCICFRKGDPTREGTGTNINSFHHLLVNSHGCFVSELNGKTDYFSPLMKEDICRVKE